MRDQGTIPAGPARAPNADAPAAPPSDRRSAAIIRSALDGILTIDHEGRVVEVNAAAERTFGRRRGELLGRFLTDLVVLPALRGAEGDGFARHLATRAPGLLGTRLETTAVRADSTELPVELAIASLLPDGHRAFVAWLRDATDRKRADDELRRRLENFAAGQPVPPAGLWVWNPATGEGFASADAHRLFGFAPGEESRTALADFPRRIHPEDRPVYDAARARAVHDRAGFDVSYRVVLPDDAIRHVRAIGRPMLGPSGEFREFIGMLVDVTEQTRLERARERHARSAALRVDVSGVLADAASMRGMLQGCAQAVVTHLDAAFARIWTLGGGGVLELQASAGAYTRLDGAYARVRVGELKIGLIALERTPYLTNDVASDPRVEDKAWARREGIVAFAGYPLVVEGRVVGVMAMFARHALEPDTLDALASVAAAVAQGVERKRAEKELRRSEAYLAEGQRLSHTGSWAWSFAGGEIFWSREMFRIYGFDPEGGTPAYEAVLQRAHPDDAPGLDKALKEAFATGTDLRLLTRILVPGQSPKWVEMYGHAVRDDEGTLVEFRGTVVDVTERVRADRRRRRALRARYAAVLAERTRIARDMHDGLLQDVAGIALQLSALIPHVRTTPDLAAERLQGLLELAERAGREARKAVAGMRERAPFADVVRAAESAAQHAAAGSPGAFALSVTVKGRARPVRGAACNAAAAIVHEAVTNVLKHAAARTVELSVSFGRGGVRLAVRDDGRGLRAREDGADGHFGLTGMRERAAAVGASLRVTGAPGRGTLVRLDMPNAY